MSAILLSSPRVCWVLMTKSFLAAMKLISLKHDWWKGFFEAPRLMTLQEDMLSHKIKTFLPLKRLPQTFRATTIVKSSKAFMCNCCSIMKGGNSSWNTSRPSVPPHPVGQASQENTWSGSENSSNNIIKIPLKQGKNKLHHRRSNLTYDGIGWADFLPWINLNQFRILAMKTLLACTQEATNDNFPTKDCSSFNVADCFCNHNCRRSNSSCTLSGVTLSVKSSELNNTRWKSCRCLGDKPFPWIPLIHMKVKHCQVPRMILRPNREHLLQQGHPGNLE